MVEPTSTGAGSVALYKLGIFGFVAMLASILVMSMTAPRSSRELVAALISTLAFSLFGGAVVTKQLGLEGMVHGDMIDMMQLCAIIFVCGTPGWVIVRAVFNWSESRKDLEIDDLIKSAKSDIEAVKKSGKIDGQQ